MIRAALGRRSPFGRPACVQSPVEIARPGLAAARDNASLDILWLKDESLADSDNLPPPDVIAQEIVEDLEAALEQFRLIAADLGAEAAR